MIDGIIKYEISYHDDYNPGRRWRAIVTADTGKYTVFENTAQEALKAALAHVVAKLPAYQAP